MKLQLPPWSLGLPVGENQVTMYGGLLSSLMQRPTQKGAPHQEPALTCQPCDWPTPDGHLPASAKVSRLHSPSWHFDCFRCLESEWPGEAVHEFLAPFRTFNEPQSTFPEEPKNIREGAGEGRWKSRWNSFLLDSLPRKVSEIMWVMEGRGFASLLSSLSHCRAQQCRMWDERWDYFQGVVVMILRIKIVKQDKRNPSNRSIGQRADVHIKEFSSGNQRVEVLKKTSGPQPARQCLSWERPQWWKEQEMSSKN